MERDGRRDPGQWRGCHTFQEIGSGGGIQKRSGGLKMGETYYYYYEVDGSTETHDPSRPSTNVCPYLPGQTVNTLEVPVEFSSRSRSASMNSLHATDFKTMDPRDKFTTPRPAPPVPDSFGPRIPTSHPIQLRHKASARSLSPSPSWAGVARRFLGLRPSSRSSDGSRSLNSRDSEDVPFGAGLGARLGESRSTTPSDSCRSRDLSPESLRRFLSEDTPMPQFLPGQAHKLTIPDEIVEDIEDDDNFATSTVSETAPFTTLSPPPFQRSLSSSSVNGNNESMTTLVPERHAGEVSSSDTGMTGPKPVVMLDTSRSYLSFSATSSSVASPISPQFVSSPANVNFSFFDESNEDDLPHSGPNDAMNGQHRHQPFAGYSLPQPATSGQKYPATNRSTCAFGYPDVVTRNESDVPIGNTSLLSLNGLDAGLNELTDEISWIANAI
ncbi:uncharacterized protein JN550_000188 [Neoarthrinium moseri]|uniref:uncharacterized protein n=1 Tax=Neoarthrinium moseri TaxID=1658444 RepID=UPI001FDAFB38|nr:uncharacterized protein JN550_000188 [Neoarthrinium moseri]KAI1878006.1 hypothetical protein JN550_000188 [Neoarthrinium moseri]